VRQNGSAGFTLHEYLTGESTAAQWCGSPVATSKRQRRLEAPTEPTGENGRPRGFLLFGTAGSWNGFRHGASDCQLFQMEPMKLLSYVEKARGRGGGLSFLFPHTVRFLSFWPEYPFFLPKKGRQKQGADDCCIICALNVSVILLFKPLPHKGRDRSKGTFTHRRPP